MNTKFNILKSALVLSALFLLRTYSFAQDDFLELLPGSESLEFDKKTGIHRLKGNVNFKYQGNIMFCDSAHYQEEDKIIRAYGKVHIKKGDTLNLYCDSLHYNGISKKATLWGNVRARDNEFKLTTEILYYNAKNSQASYTIGGKVQSSSSNEILTSTIGYFYPESKNFFFSKDVYYKGDNITMKTDTLRYMYNQKKTFFYGPTEIFSDGSDMYCESGWYNTITKEGALVKNAWISRDSDYISGDTLYYIPMNAEYIGIGNVHYVDSIQHMEFKSDYAYSSDSLHYSLLTGRAIASKHMDDDTLHIHADTLYNFKNDTLEYLLGYHSAQIYSTDFQGQADSLTFLRSAGKIELHHAPIVWSKMAELKGVFIDIDLINDTIVQYVNIYNNASILMEVESEQYYNQIAGKNITARFINNELVQATVLGNATTISFPEDEKKTDSLHTIERMGMNRLYSSKLRIDIDSSQIVGITYLEKPDGAFYPMDQINKEEQFIPKFQWNDALRPKGLIDLLKD